MSLRWTSYLHVSHNPVLALVGKKAVGSKSAINDNVAERGWSKHTVTSFEPKREESGEIVYRDVRKL